MTEQEPLEQKVKKHRGAAIKGFLIGAAMAGIAGLYTGARHELNNDTLYDRSIKNEIKDAALDGYAWKEGCDPSFYEFERPILVLDSASRTMQGHLMKYLPNDTIDAGPMLQGGKIGYLVQDKLKQEFQEDVQDVRKFFDRMGEGVKEGYERTEEQFQKWFNKQDTTYAQ